MDSCQPPLRRRRRRRPARPSRLRQRRRPRAHAGDRCSRPSPTLPSAWCIDFAGVDYISSVGLRVLMIAAKAMRARRGRIAVAGCSRSSPRSSPSAASTTSSTSSTRRPTALAGDLGRCAGGLRDLHRALAVGREARPLLGHARLAAGRAHRRRRARRLVAAVRGARGLAAAVGTRDVEDYVDGLDFALAGTFGGHTSCVEIETGGPDYVLCDLGSGVRPFGEAALARHGPRRRRRPITSSCPTCTGTTSWGCRSSRRRTSPATASASTADTRISKRRSGGRWIRRRSRSTSRPCAATSSSSICRPAVRHEVAGMTVTRCASGTPAIPTATASSTAAGRSCTRPTPSTS